MVKYKKKETCMTNQAEAQPGTVHAYGYRWVVIGVFFFFTLMSQVFWIAFAPITSMAAQFYGVSELWIGFLAMSFMYIYIPLAIPASWAIDTYGFKKTVGAAAVIYGICGLVRGLMVGNFTAVLVATIGMAIAQPLVLNSPTKIAAKWFPLEERASVVGIAFMGSFLGIMLGQILTPIFVESFGFGAPHLIFGIAGAVAAVLFLLFAREDPPTPAGYEERVLMLEGIKLIFKKGDFYLMAAVIFIVNLIFNGIATWVEGIVRPKGLSPTEVGLAGGLLFLGAIVGVLVIPPFSDRLHKRKVIFLVPLMVAVPAMIGLTYLQGPTLVMLFSFLLGFFMLGAAPVAIQYATEICYPAPEGTSMGIFTLVGQFSVVGISVMGWSYARYGSFTPSMLVMAILLAVFLLVLTRVRESPMIQELAKKDD
jgi:MFS family permease